MEAGLYVSGTRRIYILGDSLHIVSVRRLSMHVCLPTDLQSEDSNEGEKFKSTFREGGGSSPKLQRLSKNGRLFS